MTTLLVLDADSVAQAAGVRFELVQAVKSAENPVLIPGVPGKWDSLQVSWPGAVLFDPSDQIFRCWYHGLNAVQSERTFVPWHPGYAESDDGVHWRKPALGVHPDDSGSNRVVADWDGWTISFVFANPDTSDPTRRFLSFWKDRATFEEPHMPRTMASSPDGYRWRFEGRPYSEPPPRHQMQDFYQVLFDVDENDPDFRYKAYSQYYMPNEAGVLIRNIGFHHGPSLTQLRDADSPVVVAPMDGIDDELHFASVAKVDTNYLMLFESDRFQQRPIHGDLRLAVSDDGRRFRRVHPKVPVVATGAKGTWDENLLVNTNASMQAVGDEIWIYYFGCPNVYTSWPRGGALRGSLFYPTYLGVATLRRDRFGCAVGAGRVETEPIDLAGRTLYVNADGEVGVRLLGGSQSVESSVVENAVNGVYRRVEWHTDPPAGMSRVEVTLPSHTRLYSLRW